MGTKNNPGPYDCYAKAAPDEPIFTMRAKDPSAPYFVRAWAFIRQGKFLEAMGEIAKMRQDPDVIARVGECEKFNEAFTCADDMAGWRKNASQSGSR